MTRTRALLAGLLAVLLGGWFMTSAAPASVLATAEPVPSCVKPTGNPTHLQMVNYDQCLSQRMEALLANAHAPAPTATVTQTVTATPSPTATATPTPTQAPSPTPTPAPTGTDLKGWDLTPTSVGLAPLGLTCSSLPAYDGPRVLDAGTTISGKRVTVPLDVSAGNIVIERSCFKPTSADVGLVEGYYPQGDITIRDSEFDGSLVPPAQLEAACAFTGGANLLRNYIHDVGSGICMVSSTNTRDFGEVPKDLLIKNNYVHKMVHFSGAHHEAATIRDFVRNAANTRTMKWVGNWLDITQTEYVSGGMFIQPTFEPIYNVWLTDNVFAGEGWNLSSHDSTSVNVVRNLHVVNNRFKQGTREYYGPVDTSGPGIVEWSENYRFDGSQPDARGTVVNP